MSKLIIVGEAPSRTSDARLAFSGRSGQRLAQLAGVESVEELREVADVVNLLDYWPGRSGKGSAFDEKRAMLAALCLVEKYEDEDATFLLSGKRVARAFGVARYTPFLEERRFKGYSVVVLPHFSTVNRWYNDEANTKAAADAIRYYIERAKEGVQR